MTSEREKVLREFGVNGLPEWLDAQYEQHGSGACLPSDSDGVNKLADEIVRLRDRIAALEAPPRVRVLTSWGALVNRDGYLVRFVRDGELEPAEKRNAQVPVDAPHRVVRVALVDDSAAEEREVTEVQRCESGCGPATTADSAGVPLCDTCAWDLDREVLGEIATLVGFDRDKHDDLVTAVRAALAAERGREP